MATTYLEEEGNGIKNSLDRPKLSRETVRSIDFHDEFIGPGPRLDAAKKNGWSIWSPNSTIS